jgi:uncharacterized protein YfeS
MTGAVIPPTTWGDRDRQRGSWPPSSQTRGKTPMGQPKLDPELCSLTNDHSPFGGDEGADVRHAYEDWLDAGRPASEFLADWYRRERLPESRFRELPEAELAERLSRDEAESVMCDYADIAFAFCRLHFEGRLTAGERDAALKAIDRQHWPCVLEWQGWSDRGYRLTMLAKMRAALLAAEVDD